MAVIWNTVNVNIYQPNSAGVLVDTNSADDKRLICLENNHSGVGFYRLRNKIAYFFYPATGNTQLKLNGDIKILERVNTSESIFWGKPGHSILSRALEIPVGGGAFHYVGRSVDRQFAGYVARDALNLKYVDLNGAVREQSVFEVLRIRNNWGKLLNYLGDTLMSSLSSLHDGFLWIARFLFVDVACDAIGNFLRPFLLEKMKSIAENAEKAPLVQSPTAASSIAVSSTAA